MAAPVAAVAGFLLLRKIIRTRLQDHPAARRRGGRLLRGHVRPGLADEPTVGSAEEPGDHHHGLRAVQRGSVARPAREACRMRTRSTGDIWPRSWWRRGRRSRATSTRRRRPRRTGRAQRGARGRGAPGRWSHHLAEPDAGGRGAQEQGDSRGADRRPTGSTRTAVWRSRHGLGSQPKPVPATNSPIKGWSTFPYFMKETAAVAIGRIIGYSHLEWLHDVS